MTKDEFVSLQLQYHQSGKSLKMFLKDTYETTPFSILKGARAHSGSASAKCAHVNPVRKIPAQNALALIRSEKCQRKMRSR